jgi:hypothetical protein
MTFSRRSAKCADVGSQLVDWVSTDLHASLGSILREIVKKAHDSYLAVEPKQLEEEKLERAIVISRERHANGAGRLSIEDNGIGQSFKSLCRATHAGNSRKPQALKDAACFRGLLSWALSAGSKDGCPIVQRHSQSLIYLHSKQHDTEPDRACEYGESWVHVHTSRRRDWGRVRYWRRGERHRFQLTSGLRHRSD